MATDANQVAEGGDTDLENPNPNPDPNEAAGEADEGNGDDSPYADLAKEMGWVPRDQYEGDNWKPADQFIRDGRDIQRETSRELKTVRAQLDTIAKTSASIVQQQVEERFQELSQRHQKAVDDGDHNAALGIASELKDLAATAAAAPQPSPDAQAWAERNSSWFRQPGQEYATAKVIEITNMLQRQGITDHAQQLKIAEQQMRREHPELFKAGMNGRKPAPGVHQPSGRTSGPSNRQKTAADLPPEARKIAKDMAERGVIKSEDDYAKNYFANLAAKG